MQVLYDAGYTDIGSPRRPTSRRTSSTASSARSTTCWRTPPATSRSPARTSGTSTRSSRSPTSTAATTTTRPTSTHANAVPLQRPRPARGRAQRPPPTTTSTLNLLNINDFHGRIDANTVGFAGHGREAARPGSARPTRCSAPPATTSARRCSPRPPTATCRPSTCSTRSTCSPRSATTSSTRGTPTSPVASPTRPNWDYLGANVYQANGDAGARRRTASSTVNGVKVGVIGAVTEETPSLVTPSGINGLAVQGPGRPRSTRSPTSSPTATTPTARPTSSSPSTTRVPPRARPTARRSRRRSPSAAPSPRSSTRPRPKVARDLHRRTPTSSTRGTARSPGAAGKTRPIMQTGSYGETVGRVTLTVNRTTGEVIVVHLGPGQAAHGDRHERRQGRRRRRAEGVRRLHGRAVRRAGGRRAHDRRHRDRQGGRRRQAAGRHRRPRHHHRLPRRVLRGGRLHGHQPERLQGARRPRVRVDAGQHRGEHAARHDGHRPATATPRSAWSTRAVSARSCSTPARPRRTPTRTAWSRSARPTRCCRSPTTCTPSS